MDTTGDFIINIKIYIKAKKYNLLYTSISIPYCNVCIYGQKFFLGINSTQKLTIVLNIKIEIKLIHFLYWVHGTN